MTNVWFSAKDAAVARAVFERMFPADEIDGGATEIGVVAFVDRALAGVDAHLQPAYRRGLQEIDAAARQRFAAACSECTAEQQDTLLAALEKGELEGLSRDEQRRFFSMLRLHLQEGLFADPIHGGNKDFAGWRFLRHPGVWFDYSAQEALQSDPSTKNDQFVGIADLPDIPNEPARKIVRPAWATRDEEVDVILVGVGVVGGLIAPTLTRAGLKVAGFEPGPWRTRGDYRPDELTYSMNFRSGMGLKFMSELPTWRPNADTPAVTAGHSLGHMVNGVGGSAAHYGAMLRRWHPHHFRERSRYEQIGGRSAIPEGCTIEDWMFSYEDLEPYYDRVEASVGVSGEDRNPFVPRQQPFQMPAMRRFRMGLRFEEAATNLGLHPYMCPIGINSEPYKGRPGARHNSWDVYCGDNTDAKWHPGIADVPEALDTGNLDLRLGCRVVRVISDHTGRARGVEYVDSDGNHAIQRASVVILCAYSLENMRLMYLSADDAHPNGLGNNADQLGRHFMSRSFNSVYGHIPGEYLNLHAGAPWQNMMVEDFHADSFNSLEHGFIGGGTLGTEQGGLPIAISRVALPDGVPQWGRGYKAHLRSWQEYAFVRMQPDALPYADHRVDLDPHRRDRSGLGLPVLRITHCLRDNEMRQYGFLVARAREILAAMGATRSWDGDAYTGALSSHDLGGCRMGHDPATSVVDRTLQVHDTRGLYVFGGAVFPSSCGVNPTLTLMATALRAAEQLVAELGATRPNLTSDRVERP